MYNIQQHQERKKNLMSPTRKMYPKLPMQKQSAKTANNSYLSNQKRQNQSNLQESKTNKTVVEPRARTSLVKLHQSLDE